MPHLFGIRSYECDCYILCLDNGGLSGREYSIIFVPCCSPVHSVPLCVMPCTTRHFSDRIKVACTRPVRRNCDLLISRQCSKRRQRLSIAISRKSLRLAW